MELKLYSILFTLLQFENSIGISIFLLLLISTFPKSIKVGIPKPLLLIVHVALTIFIVIGMFALLIIPNSLVLKLIGEANEYELIIIKKIRLFFILIYLVLVSCTIIIREIASILIFDFEFKLILVSFTLVFGAKIPKLIINFIS